MSSIHCLALQVAHGELAEQVRIGGRVPTLIDAIGNAAEQDLLCFGREKTVETTAKCRGGDFMGVGCTDRGKLGRESSRERVCKYVKNSGVGVISKKKNNKNKIQ